MFFRTSLLLLAALLAAPVWAQDSLVVYSGRSDKFVKPVVDAFTKQTGIKVILHNAKSTALLNKLRIEADKTRADIFLSNDAGNLQKGADLGLFTKVSGASANVIDAQFRATDNTWIGLSARARVLVENTNSKNAGTVKSVFDLADPRLKDRIAITHSGNGSFVAGVTVYADKVGDKKTADWLNGLKSNSGGKVFNKHSKIVKAVASGKKDVGLVNHYYIYRHLAKKPNAPIRIVFPDQGSGDIGVAWNVAGVAISKYSKNTASAQKFVDFLVSKQGQKIFAEVNREYPTRNGVPSSKQVPARDSYKVADVPMAVLGKKRDATLNLIDSVGMP